MLKIIAVFKKNIVKKICSDPRYTQGDDCDLSSEDSTLSLNTISLHIPQCHGPTGNDCGFINGYALIFVCTIDRLFKPVHFLKNWINAFFDLNWYY